jgi:hypothetical protein
MFNDHLFSYRLPARLLVSSTLFADFQSIRIYCPKITLSIPAPIFLEPFPFKLCSAHSQVNWGSKALAAGKNRDFFLPGPSVPVNGKEDAS